MDTSVSYVSHGTLGWSKEKDPSRGTHVVLSREFYSYLDGQQLTIENLKRDLNWYKNERGQYLPTIDKLKREVSRLEDEMENLVRSANSSQYSEAEVVKMNEELYRICKERANAERGLRPKKEHSGYCLQQSTQVERRYGSNTEKAWETVIQTPYPAEIPANSIVGRVIKELFGGRPAVTEERNEPQYFKCAGLMRKCGIINTIRVNDKENYRSLIFMANREEPGNIYSKPIRTTRDMNIAFDFSVRQDFKNGYWLAMFSHVYSLNPIPADMLPARKNRKNGNQREKENEAE